MIVYRQAGFRSTLLIYFSSTAGQQVCRVPGAAVCMRACSREMAAEHDDDDLKLGVDLIVFAVVT